MKKQNIAIIGVIALILVVSVGYALFSQSLTINGTAKASGNVDVQFITIGDIQSSGYTDVNAPTQGDTTEAAKARVATISSDGRTLTITVDKLSYPGAYVKVPVTVQNKGTIPVKLKEIKQVDGFGNVTVTHGSDSNTSAINVTYTGAATTDAQLNQNDTKDMSIMVKWDENATGPEGTNSVTDSVTFTVELVYEQITATTE